MKRAPVTQENPIRPSGRFRSWLGAVRLAAAVCCLTLAAGAELTEVRTVYLLSMSHSLDQFIANRLIRMHVLQVVTDPSKADTVITDHVGEGFEDKLKDLYPPPPAPHASATDAKTPASAPPEAKEPAQDKTESPAAKEDTAKTKEDPAKTKEASVSSHSTPNLLGDTANKAEKRGSMSSFGRARGTIFLVDVKSRQVLWSAFEQPKSTQPSELDRTAERIVKRLKEDLAPK